MFERLEVVDDTQGISPLTEHLSKYCKFVSNILAGGGGILCPTANGQNPGFLHKWKQCQTHLRM